MYQSRKAGEKNIEEKEKNEMFLCLSSPQGGENVYIGMVE